jgi:hypothetical protein
LGRQLDKIRKSWIKDVRKVVEAPLGTEVLVRSVQDGLDSIHQRAVHVVNDPGAVHVTLTRDLGKADGTFMHEEVSDCIFDEINNVVDANRILTKDQRRFFLGPQVYYRVYAERRLIRQKPDQIELLFHSAVSELYAPNLFWTLDMDAGLIARDIAALHLVPKSPQIHWLMRFAMLLGHDFCSWLYGRWDQKWHKYSQPPTFYFTFREMLSGLDDSDLRVSAARSSPVTRFSVPGQAEATYPDLASNPERAEALLSSACMAVFDGNLKLRATARDLDYIAHGLGITQRAEEISAAVRIAIGYRPPGDYRDSVINQ